MSRNQCHGVVQIRSFREAGQHNLILLQSFETNDSGEVAFQPVRGGIGLVPPPIGWAEFLGVVPTVQCIQTAALWGPAPSKSFVSR